MTTFLRDATTVFARDVRPSLRNPAGLLFGMGLHVVAQSVQFPLLLSGALPPLETAPGRLRTLGRINPVTYIVDAQRALRRRPDRAQRPVRHRMRPAPSPRSASTWATGPCARACETALTAPL